MLEEGVDRLRLLGGQMLGRHDGTVEHSHAQLVVLARRQLPGSFQRPRREHGHAGVAGVCARAASRRARRAGGGLAHKTTVGTQASAASPRTLASKVRHGLEDGGSRPSIRSWLRETGVYRLSGTVRWGGAHAAREGRR